MQYNSTRTIRRTLVAVGALAALVACGDDDNDITNSVIPTSRYTVTPLVADANGFGAGNIDPNLVNAWGLAFGPTGILWVANESTGTSTLYDPNGVTQSLVVTIPSAAGATGGHPTGTIFNGTSDFLIPRAGIAHFLFAGADGTITGWNAGTQAVVVADRSAQNAVYLGLAIASNANANFLYAANFKNNSIDVFDSNFQFVKSFTDPTLPAGYGPFSVHAIGGQLWVAYAKQKPAPDNGEEQAGPGLGFVDIFNPNGTLASRFASNGALNAPWGIAVAPAGFGTFSGAILIGNFGDGRIGAYDPITGGFIDYLRDGNDNQITIDGLWGITGGPASQPSSLFFASGPSDETHGVVGRINVR